MQPWSGPTPERDLPRFAGLPTFMKYPVLDPANPASIVVLGAPFDGGTTFQPGARFGPEAIRRHSAGLYPYHRHYRRTAHALHSIADGGDVAVIPMSVERTFRAIEERLRLLPQTSRVLLLGGDHSVALPHLRWVAGKTGPVALVHLDAHHDLWNEFWGERYNHATVFRRAVEEGLVDVAHSIQVGMRGSLDEADEDGYGAALGLTQVTTEEWFGLGAEWVAEKVYRQIAGAGAVYVSVDIDVVDPAFAPGTGTPESGGPSSYMVLALLRRLRRRIAGADVVELAPALDPTSASSLFAATVAQELLFLLTEPE